MATGRKGWSGARDSLATDYHEIGELAGKVRRDGSAASGRRTGARLLLLAMAPFLAIGRVLNRRVALPRLRWGWPRPRTIVSLAGIGLILTGIGVVGLPLLAVWKRGQTDSQALQQWNHGGSNDLVGAAPNTGGTSGPSCGSSSPSESYALVTFPSLSQYGYSGVAGNGDWSGLLQRSMVHYAGSAAPGQVGNDIIAFHREPNFQHIDQLKPGAIVEVQDRDCTVWHYQVTSEQTLAPNQITQLGQTSDAELTLITCTPWFQDYDRLVWRAKLLDKPTNDPATPAPTSASVPFPVVTPPPYVAPTSEPGSASTPAPTPKATPKPTPAQSSKPGSPAPSNSNPKPTPTPGWNSACGCVTATPPPTVSQPPPPPPPAPTPTPTPTPTPAPTPTPSPSPSPSPTSGSSGSPSPSP